MYTASWVQFQVEAMKGWNTPKADIIRATAELRLGWQYVYASQGQDCTPAWRKSRIPYCPSQKYVDMINNNCPVLSGKQPAIYCNKPHSNEKMISPESCNGCSYIDTDVFDCAGFVLNEMQLAGVPFYGQGATTQWNTPSNWVAKGEINTMPKGLVCAIYKQKDGKMSHTGLSMGDGSGGVIHCSTTVKRGNVNTDRPAWTHWGIPKGLYSSEELKEAGFNVDDSKNTPTIRKGMSGDAVKKMQQLLNKSGANLKPDGIFGAQTESTVKQFQKDHGLTVDGICGPKTWAKLDQFDDGIEVPEEPVADKDQLVWDMLYSAIKNSYGVAGIMGNLQAESGINSENLQNTGERALGMTDSQYTKAIDDGSYTNFTNDNFGYGIAQWTYSSRKKNLLNYAQKIGSSIGDMAMQLSFLLDELRFEYSSVWYALLNSASVKEASDAFMLKFERPKNQSEENMKRRAELGQRFYDKYSAAEEHHEPEPTELDELKTRVAKLENQVSWLFDLIQSK